MAGRHDHAERRAGVRKGRERGCWVYLTASTLERAGFDPHGPVPFYRTWSNPRRVLVQLYREK
jgi:hypothetical protein